MVLCACKVSYKFNGASIDYTKTKTIQIDNFPIRSAYVWAPMQSIFQNKLTDIFASQTKLRQVKRTATCSSLERLQDSTNSTRV